MICTCDCIYSFNALLMMGAENTGNMSSNLAVNNKYDCLKLHHVGFLKNTLQKFPTLRNKSDRTSDIRNILVYCCRMLKLSPLASLQRLSSLRNAPQESSYSCRIRTNDSSVRSPKPCGVFDHMTSAIGIPPFQ